VQSIGCRVVEAMEVEGIMNVIPTLHFPFNISLEVGGVTRVLQPHVEAGASPSSSQTEMM
jgi:hypothetical protein